MHLCSLIKLIGWAVFLKVAFNFCRWLVGLFLPSLNAKRWGLEDKACVVITGGAEGIGRGFAEEFALRGFPLIIFDKDEPELLKTQQELIEKYKVPVEIYPQDFRESPLVWYPRIRSILADRDIGVLVNNVGICNNSDITGLGAPGWYKDQKYEDQIAMMNVNNGATLAMTNMVLPGMIDRRRGAMIFLASFVGDFPVPSVSIYAASKKFNDHLAGCLYNEVSEYNIDILACRPYYVRTRMTGLTRPSLINPSPRRLAHDALRYLGRRIHVSPYWVHPVLETLMRILPFPVLIFLMKKMMNATQLACARHLLKKKEREAKAKADQAKAN